MLVCGGRTYADVDAVYAALDRAHAKRPITLLIHGDAAGADVLGAAWARLRCIPHLGHPADWSRHGKGAGPKRNQAMLSYWRPEGVIAFSGGAGTADMMKRARCAGLPVLEPCALSAPDVPPRGRMMTVAPGAEPDHEQI